MWTHSQQGFLICEGWKYARVKNNKIRTTMRRKALMREYGCLICLMLLRIQWLVILQKDLHLSEVARFNHAYVLIYLFLNILWTWHHFNLSTVWQVLEQEMCFFNILISLINFSWACAFKWVRFDLFFSWSLNSSNRRSIQLFWKYGGGCHGPPLLESSSISLESLCPCCWVN
jgi:hypothetical protein